MEEKFKSIEEVDGKYLISNLGRVKNSKTGKILTQSKFHKRRHWKVGLVWKGKILNRTIHTLVWDSFNGPRDKSKVIDHIDNNPLNNRLDNLQEITQRENSIKDRKPSNTNTLGVYQSTEGKYIASMHLSQKKRKIHLGSFDYLSKAKSIYDLAIVLQHKYNGHDWMFRELLDEESAKYIYKRSSGPFRLNIRPLNFDKSYATYKEALNKKRELILNQH